MISQEIFDYMVNVRRRIHRHPEIGFDLPVTAALVRDELDKMGVPYTEKFAPCSVVGYIGGDPAKKTLAIRADMDALPVEEKVDLPFKSEIPGRMHACGHDTHTAILLGLARILKQEEKDLPCNVRLFFQPCEEGEESGARAMTENGAMEGVDAICCTHCDVGLDVGKIGLYSGWFMAACMPFTITFHGRTSHATQPAGGIDAIRMAHEAFAVLDKAAPEVAGSERFIWSVGVVEGGTAHNVIADTCRMVATFRYFDPAYAKRWLERVEKECRAVADRFGGTVEVKAVVSSNAVYNDPDLVARFRAATEPDPDLKLVDVGSRMGSEDFNWYLKKAPGFLFRYGVRNEKEGCDQPGHSNCFKVDENGMKYAATAFYRFVKNYS